MPTIRISDDTGAELLSAQALQRSAFAKFVKGDAAHLLAGAGVAAQLAQPLAAASADPLGVKLVFQKDFPLAGTGVSLSVSTGARAAFGVFNRAGKAFLGEGFLAPELTVPNGQAYVSFSFVPSAEVSAKPALGDVNFSIRAGTGAELRYFRVFDAGAGLTLARACQTVLEHYAIPATVDDLRAMTAGDVATVSGHTELKIGARLDVAAGFNPLATLQSIPKIGAVALKLGASASAGVEAGVSGEFELRVRRIDERFVRLSVHKARSGTIGVKLAASANTGLSVADKDLLKMFFGGEPALADGSKTKLTASGLPKEKLDELLKQSKAALSRKLSLELAASFSALKENQSAFEYELDLDKLDETGTKAVNDALAGDLRAIIALEAETAKSGVRVMASRVSTLNQRRVTWRVNLLGIVNVLSMSEFTREAAIFFDGDSGELVMTDRATQKRLGATLVNRELRRAQFEAMMITATYKAAGLDVTRELKASQTFFHFDEKTNRQELSDFLDAVAAVGLISPVDIPSLLGGARRDFGATSLLLETEFDQHDCEDCFLVNGVPRTEGDFQLLGRNAVLALVSETDPDSYRRLVMERDGLWAVIVSEGPIPHQFRQFMPLTIAGDQTRLEAVSRDAILILWWASAMAEAAKKLAAVRELLAPGVDPANIEKNAEFQKRREALAKALGKAVKENKSNFDDPWGLVAMFFASRRQARATATLTLPERQLRFPEES